MKSLFAPLMLLAAMPLCAHAETWIVDPGNPKALQSIAQASHLQPGDSLLLARGGDFAAPLRITTKGSTKQRIYIGPCGDTAADDPALASLELSATAYVTIEGLEIQKTVITRSNDVEVRLCSLSSVTITDSNTLFFTSDIITPPNSRPITVEGGCDNILIRRSVIDSDSPRFIQGSPSPSRRNKRPAELTVAECFFTTRPQTPAGFSSPLMDGNTVIAPDSVPYTPSEIPLIQTP